MKYEKWGSKNYLFNKVQKRRKPGEKINPMFKAELLTISNKTVGMRRMNKHFQILPHFSKIGL